MMESSNPVPERSMQPAPLRQLVMPGMPWGAFLPFQHTSLEHLDARVRQIVTTAASVEDLAPTTQRWMHYSYRVFRHFLKESGSEEAFLAGDLRQQARVLQAWIAWMRNSDPPRRRSTISAHWRGVRVLCGTQQGAAPHRIAHSSGENLGRAFPGAGRQEPWASTSIGL